MGQPAYKDIVATFGTQVLNDDAQRTLNRAALAKLVFGNREARRRLNKITHGRIARRMLRHLLTFSLLKRKPVCVAQRYPHSSIAPAPPRWPSTPCFHFGETVAGRVG